MPVSLITRRELRKRHPGLKKNNNKDLDSAIGEITKDAYGFYVTNGKPNVSGHYPQCVSEVLSKLDEPARAALRDYFAHLLEIVNSS